LVIFFATLPLAAELTPLEATLSFFLTVAELILVGGLEARGSNEGN
jgi:hypothetical protein